MNEEQRERLHHDIKEKIFRRWKELKIMGENQKKAMQETLQEKERGKTKK